jgi:hypothetical protein
MEANTNFSDVLDEFHRERVEAIAMLERCLNDRDGRTAGALAGGAHRS